MCQYSLFLLSVVIGSISEVRVVEVYEYVVRGVMIVYAIVRMILEIRATILGNMRIGPNIWIIFVTCQYRQLPRICAIIWQHINMPV